MVKWRCLLEWTCAWALFIASAACRLVLFPDWREHLWSIPLEIALFGVGVAFMEDAKRSD
jgi:hypothetical protein